MPDYFFTMAPYILLATGAGLVGGFIALTWDPKPKARSAIQHFAAGAVLAAVASNVIPEVERLGTFPGIVGGLTAGAILMIGLKWLITRLEHQEKQKGKLPLGLAAAAAVDTLLDGTLIGAGFSAGQQLGTLLAFALAIELLFLTLSVGVEFRKGQLKPWQILAVTAGVAALLPVGAFGISMWLQDASEPALAAVLAFGAAALIYLVAEELLVETIEAEASIFPTATLFAGFLLLIALKLMGTHGP